MSCEIWLEKPWDDVYRKIKPKVESVVFIVAGVVKILLDLSRDY